jgi:hypothetical protein
MAAAISLLSKIPEIRNVHWVVGRCDNLERALSLRNALLPTTQCACADFGDLSNAMAAAAVKMIYIATHTQACEVPQGIHIWATTGNISEIVPRNLKINLVVLNWDHVPQCCEHWTRQGRAGCGPL